MFFLLFVGDAEEILEKEELHYVGMFGSLLIMSVDVLHNRFETLSVIL